MCATALESASHGRDWLAGLSLSLRHRKAEFSNTLHEFFAEFCGAVRESVRQCRDVVSLADKAAAASAEAWKVTGEQLEAYALIFEAGEQGEGGEAAAELLLAQMDSDAQASPHAVFVHSEPFPPITTPLFALQCGIDPAACTVAGSGWHGFVAGEGEGVRFNTFTVCVCHAPGIPVATLRDSDVCVSLPGACVASITPHSAGVVTVHYSVPTDCVTSLSAAVTVCGAPLRASPWLIEVCCCPLHWC